jgi:predicted ABC-type exoprotein transport system permease subunit
MEHQNINEQRVETAFSNIEKLRQSARNRAYSDYLDEMVDERMEKEGIKRDSFQNWIVQYLKGLLDDD